MLHSSLNYLLQYYFKLIIPVMTDIIKMFFHVLEGADHLKEEGMDNT